MTSIFKPRKIESHDLDLQAETIIFIIAFSALTIVLQAISVLSLDVFDQARFFTLCTVLALQLLFLAAIRFTGRVESIALLYHSITLLTLYIDATLKAKSFLATSFGFFPTTIAAAFLTLRTPWKRVFIVTMSFVLSIGALGQIYQMGPLIPYARTLEQYLQHLRLGLLAQASVALVCALFYIRYKNLNEGERTQHLEDQLNAARMSEVNNLVASLFPDLKQPLRKLQAETALVQKDLSQLSAEKIAAIENQLAAINQTAQTVGWIYRAYRNESVNRMKASFVGEQLKLLFERKARHAETKVNLIRPDHDFEVEGLIPSVVLILLNLMDMLSEALPDLRNLTLAVERTPNIGEVRWILTVDGKPQNAAWDEFWRAKDEDPKWILEPGTLRRELIRDLSQTCRATISLTEGPQQTEIRVEGAFSVQS